MTSNPITIAGETLTEQDWPVGVDWFDADGTWEHPNDGSRGVFVIETRFHPDNLYCAVFWLCDNAPECNLREEHRKLLPWIAARCRCWFLDKAAEVYRNDPSQGFLTLTEMDEVKKSQSEIARYLDSAEKWARIGRAK